jgi:hypothetical protein
LKGQLGRAAESAFLLGPSSRQLHGCEKCRLGCGDGRDGACVNFPLGVPSVMGRLHSDPHVSVIAEQLAEPNRYVRGNGLPLMEDVVQDFLSRLDGWPMRSPADASPPPSRTTTHGSRPM